MRRVVIGCLLLASFAGCNRAEKQSLKQFLEAVAASLGRPYDDQLKGVADPERYARFRVLWGRDQLAAADTYLNSQPPIGAAARRSVEGYRAAVAGELGLFERAVAEKRYKLTEAEKAQEAELRRTAQDHLEAIGRLIDQ
jgi:hypothetical protein